jgi:dTDP-4-amino-4,6-dideoxygalactose transaminase
MGCFSFYPGKNLGACGEGGLVTTDDAAHRRKLRMLRDWGAETKYQHVLRGFNYRMEGIQGAVLRVKLRRLDAWTEARRARAQQYDSLLANAGVVTPEVRADARHVYHLYVVRSLERSAWQRALADQGISTGIHYPTPVHLLPAFAGLGHRRGDFPYSERAADQVLSLPMFAELGEAQCARVAAAVRNLAATPMAEATLSA